MCELIGAVVFPRPNCPHLRDDALGRVDELPPSLFHPLSAACRRIEIPHVVLKRQEDALKSWGGDLDGIHERLRNLRRAKRGAFLMRRIFIGVGERVSKMNIM